MPLTGVGFVIVAIIGFAISGQPPSADNHSPQEIVNHYVDNKDSIQAGALVLMIALLLLLYFGSYLHKVLRRGAGETGMLSRAAFAGIVIFAVGAAVDMTLLFAMSEAAGKVDPVAVQALQAFWDNDFMPLALGIDLFILSCGLSIVLHRSMPVWMGWAALVIGVVGLTPLGFLAFLGAGVWIVVASVLLTLKDRNRVVELPDHELPDHDRPVTGVPAQQERVRHETGGGAGR
ncbi:MAG: rane protein [Frankiales bacterium]|nr:rane protein [Frankiales bacterium]